MNKDFTWLPGAALILAATAAALFYAAQKPVDHAAGGVPVRADTQQVSSK